MFGFKSPESLAAEVKMIRTDYRGAFLVLEGLDDVRFWSSPDRAGCEYIDAGGKTNVTGSIRLLDNDRFKGVLGLVDDDYDSLEGVELESENVIATNVHDLECLLCRSRALDSVLSEFGDRSKIDQFERVEGIDVRTGILRRSLIFGQLRWASVRFDLDICQDAIIVPRFLDRDRWSIDTNGLLRAVIKPNSKHDENFVRQCIGQLPSVDPWRVVRGHDAIAVMRLGFQNILGSVGPNVGYDDIARVLRVGMSLQELKTTSVWTEIREWEDRNIPYTILSS